jgi:hypothetical protein
MSDVRVRDSNKTLSDAERELVRLYRVCSEGVDYQAEIRIKILKTAHDFQVWLRRNPEWAHDIEDAFFRQFGFERDAMGDGTVVYRGVRAILDVVDNLNIKS